MTGHGLPRNRPVSLPFSLPVRLVGPLCYAVLFPVMSVDAGPALFPFVSLARTPRVTSNQSPAKLYWEDSQKPAEMFLGKRMASPCLLARRMTGPCQPRAEEEEEEKQQTLPSETSRHPGTCQEVWRRHLNSPQSGQSKMCVAGALSALSLSSSSRRLFSRVLCNPSSPSSSSCHPISASPDGSSSSTRQWGLLLSTLYSRNAEQRP